MTDFGRADPRSMPGHFFFGSVRLDYARAVRADTSKQHCSICPRYWYVDATFRCRLCGREFCFTAAEQRHWFEELGFWVDALPRHCHECRVRMREMTALRQEYDRDVQWALGVPDLEAKRRLASVIDLLCEMGGELPQRINENRRRLVRQIAELEDGAA